MGVINQVLTSAVASYIFMIVGLMSSWPSSTLKLFGSENTPLNRPMRGTELALVGSIASIGSLISTPVTGYFLDKIGRKYCILICPLTHMIAWSIVAITTQVELVLAAIFLSGAGGSVFLVLPVYVSEMAHESIRGLLTTGSMIFYVVGFLISYWMGGSVEYKTMIYFCLSACIMSVILVTFLKESPVFLMSKGQEEEAAKVIAFYRSAKIDSKEVLQEMDSLRRAFNPDLGMELKSNVTPEEERLKPNEKTKEKLSLWQFIRKSKSTRRAMVVTLTLVTSGIFQGMVVLQVYADPLFEEAVPNMSPTLCSVLLAVITIIAGLSAAYLTDSAGRRPLMLYSSLATGLCCLALGSQLHFHWGPHWITAVLIYVFCIPYTFGAGTVPWLLVPEVFLPEVKSFMSMFVIEYGWLCNFIILFIFNPVVSAVGLGPVFYFFAVVSFLSTLFCYFFQPETRGLPVDAIQLLFVNDVRNRRVSVS